LAVNPKPFIAVLNVVICRGEHNFFLVSYSGVYREMVFGTHPKHSPTCNIGSYESYPKDIPFSIHIFLSTAGFFAPPFFYKTAAAWPRSVWISHSKERCNQLILRSSPVYPRCTAHMSTFQCAYHSFRATAHLTLAPLFEKNIFLFFACGEHQSISSMYFVFSFLFFSF
jgi:hypothetical protein